MLAGHQTGLYLGYMHVALPPCWSNITMVLIPTSWDWKILETRITTSTCRRIKEIKIQICSCAKRRRKKNTHRLQTKMNKICIQNIYILNCFIEIECLFCCEIVQSVLFVVKLICSCIFGSFLFGAFCFCYGFFSFT